MISIRERADRFTAWLLGTPADVPPAIALQLRNGLFASVPIFLGGVLNTTAVAAVATWRHPVWPFIGWLLFEIALGVVRLGVLMHGKSSVASGHEPPALTAAALSCGWAGSVGFGTYLCLTSGDWVLAAIACLSAAAMVCGMCLRNFGTPRLVAAMVTAALGPCALAGVVTAEPVLIMISVQLPIFMVTILSAAFGLHRMMVSRMTTLNELERSKSLTEKILDSIPDHTLILDKDCRVVFCKRPGEVAAEDDPLLGRNWLSLLPPECLEAATRAIAEAAAGQAVNVAVNHESATGVTRWYDTVINRIDDFSGRLIVVSRDITHQKKSEDRAMWMAQHDSLTGLPNRALLQKRLDALLADPDQADRAAMLIVDIDNFKSINDTLGHDAGDALLCTVACRLIDAVSDDGMVARTGGDEFVLLVTARSDDAVRAVSERILSHLRKPINHNDRLLECSASIGASIIPRDGTDRSAIMKAADIALYAAKAGGRAQLKIFEPAMMAEVERHQSMIASARLALQRDAIVPFYQPKVCLRSSRVVGFEALLRWRDRAGDIRGPDAIEAAFEDPALGPQLSGRMFEKVMDDVQWWIASGVAFEHVAVNVTSSDFRQYDFTDMIRKLLSERDIAPSYLQIEVTENVFLSRDADDVKQALRELSDLGIRIALDDFGTGYASLSHLSQFPVNVLKIDRSFTQRIGQRTDADAISSAVINLGQCLGMEVVAEGIETAAQEAQLLKMGCNTGQGFLYSPALPAAEIPAVLRREHEGAALRRA